MITRRDYFLRCSWWSVDKTNPELADLKYKDVPSGVFFAKETQALNKNDELDNGFIPIAKQSLIIETKDDVEGINQKDLVECMGQKWIVESIQSQVVHKRTQYYNRAERIWTLTLRSGK